MLWRASPDFRSKLGPLLSQETVALSIDDDVDISTCGCFHFNIACLSHVEFARYNKISDAGLWGLLYYTGYLTMQTFAKNGSLVRD